MNVSLYEEIINRELDNLSIVGMEKNVGKTETLKYLINLFIINNRNLGLTSTGRDGEKQDVVYLSEKPFIWASEGFIIATARDCIVSSEAGVEILHNTEYNTPMGEVIIGKIREPGNIELAGPGSNKALKDTIEIMKEFGADFVMVDGALNRVSSAAPSVTDGTLLASGSALGDSINLVVEKTLLRVNLFNLEKYYSPLEDKAAEIVNNKKIAVVDDHGIHTLKLSTALTAGREVASSIDKNTSGIYVGGAVVDSFLNDIMNNSPVGDLEIVVKDGTKIFIENMTYKRFINKGGRFKVIDPIKLVGVTINPLSPTGYSFDGEKLLEKMGEAIEPLPAFDVILDKGFKGGLKFEGVSN